MEFLIQHWRLHHGMVLKAPLWISYPQLKIGACFREEKQRVVRVLGKKIG